MQHPNNCNFKPLKTKEMNHNKQELIIIKDALIEHWHNSMKHAKDSTFKEMCRCLMEDYKVLAAKP